MSRARAERLAHLRNRVTSTEPAAPLTTRPATLGLVLRSSQLRARANYDPIHVARAGLSKVTWAARWALDGPLALRLALRTHGARGWSSCFRPVSDARVDAASTCAVGCPRRVIVRSTANVESGTPRARSPHRRECVWHESRTRWGMPLQSERK